MFGSEGSVSGPGGRSRSLTSDAGRNVRACRDARCDRDSAGWHSSHLAAPTKADGSGRSGCSDR